jgi:hypothetical protein
MRQRMNTRKLTRATKCNKGEKEIPLEKVNGAPREWRDAPIR